MKSITAYKNKNKTKERVPDSIHHLLDNFSYLSKYPEKSR